MPRRSADIEISTSNHMAARVSSSHIESTQRRPQDPHKIPATPLHGETPDPRQTHGCTCPKRKAQQESRYTTATPRVLTLKSFFFESKVCLSCGAA